MEHIPFSALICVYGKDHPVYFKTAVDSVLNQSIKPDEIVIIVDGPVPETLNTILSIYEKNDLFHVIRLRRNQGHGNARRAGLENCKYDLIALMDADDISLFDRFEKQLSVFKENPLLSIVGGNIEEFVGTPDNVTGARIVPSEDMEIKRFLKKRCPFNQVTVMCRKSDVKQAGGYMDWYCDEDYYLWIRMFLANMQFANVEDTLVNVRVGKEMYQRRGGWKYFESEAKLQKYMFQNKVIGFSTYAANCSKRFILQVLMPNKMRGWVFKKFARKSVTKHG